MLPVNQLLQNRYRIVRLLGQGGMGAVYLAVDERLGHEVALKQMFHAQQEVLAQAFEREAKILARLHHRCLPKVSDHFSEGDARYLVMQYIAGEDLADYLSKYRRPLPVEQVIGWADNLLEALEYLHGHEPPILHRDIKPQNIKLSTGGELFLLDFGLAKDTKTSFSQSHLPSVIGFSFNYSPLEQINRERTTAETDIYAFAATLYHLLTNRLPADSFSRLTAKADALADPLIPADQLNPNVSADLAAILQKGMELRREQRPNAAQFRQWLKDIKPIAVNELPTSPIDFSRKTAAATQPLPFSSPVLDGGSSADAPKSQNYSASLTSDTSQSPTNTIDISSQPNGSEPKTAVVKPLRNFLLLGVTLIIFLFVGTGAAIIGVVQFFPWPQPVVPGPVPTQQLSPAPADSATPAPANTVGNNTNLPADSPRPKTPPPKTSAEPAKTSSPKSQTTKTVKPQRAPPTIIPQ
jgi:serine/threonine protein kinase